MKTNLFPAFKTSPGNTVVKSSDLGLLKDILGLKNDLSRHRKL